MAYTNTPVTWVDKNPPTEAGTPLKKVSFDTITLSIDEIQALFQKDGSGNALIDVLLTLQNGLTISSGGANVTGAATFDSTLTTGGDITASISNSGNITNCLILVNPNSGVVGTGVQILFSGTPSLTRGAYIRASVTNTGNAHKLEFGASATSASPTTIMTVDSNGVDIEETLTTGGKVQINNTSAPGTPSGGAVFYSVSGEMYVKDTAGNQTQLSPHDPETNETYVNEFNSFTGVWKRNYIERKENQIVIEYLEPTEDWIVVKTKHAYDKFKAEKEKITKEKTIYEEVPEQYTKQIEIPDPKDSKKKITVDVLKTKHVVKEKVIQERVHSDEDIEVAWNGKEGEAYRAENVPEEPAWIDTILKKNPHSERCVSQK